MIEFLRDNFSLIILSTIGGVAGFYYAENYYPKETVFMVDEVASMIYSTVSKKLEVVKPYIPSKLVEKLPMEDLSPQYPSNIQPLRANILGHFFWITEQLGVSKSVLSKLLNEIQANKVSITCSITGYMLVYCTLKKYIRQASPRSRATNPSDPLSLLIGYMEHLLITTCRMFSNHEVESMLLVMTLLLATLYLNPDIKLELMSQRGPFFL